MIRATATVVLHNFSMYANAAAKGNAVLVTFHSQPWCLIGPVSLLNEPEKKDVPRLKRHGRLPSVFHERPAGSPRQHHACELTGQTAVRLFPARFCRTSLG